VELHRARISSAQLLEASSRRDAPRARYIKRVTKVRGDIERYNSLAGRQKQVVKFNMSYHIGHGFKEIKIRCQQDPKGQPRKLRGRLHSFVLCGTESLIFRAFHHPALRCTHPLGIFASFCRALQSAAEQTQGYLLNSLNTYQRLAMINSVDIGEQQRNLHLKGEGGASPRQPSSPRERAAIPRSPLADRLGVYIASGPFFDGRREGSEGITDTDLPCSHRQGDCFEGAAPSDLLHRGGTVPRNAVPSPPPGTSRKVRNFPAQPKRQRSRGRGRTWSFQRDAISSSRRGRIRRRSSVPLAAPPSWICAVLARGLGSGKEQARPHRSPRNRQAQSQHEVCALLVVMARIIYRRSHAHFILVMSHS
jgi:hypothetical protein